jgi:hypothetical protein
MQKVGESFVEKGREKTTFNYRKQINETAATKHKS